MELRAAPGGGVLELLFAAPFVEPVFGSYWADSDALGTDSLPGLTARRKDRLGALAQLDPESEALAMVLGQLRAVLDTSAADKAGAEEYVEVARTRITGVADALADPAGADLGSRGFLSDLWWVDELFTSLAFAGRSGGRGGAANFAPVAGGDSFSIATNTALAVDGSGVLANDFDPNGRALSVSVVSPPAHAASFEFYADGSFSYQPEADYVGPDQFVYRASDGQFTDDGTVSLLLTNQPPVARDDGAYSAKGQTVSVYVLANDYDPDGNYPLTVTAVTQPAHGTAGYTSNTVTYAPNPDFVSGSDSFQYTVRDSLGASSQGLVTINMLQVTGFALDRQLLDYSWTPVADNEVTWLSDTLRWTAQYSPRNPPTATSSEWRYKPWAQRDNPAYPWSMFMVVSGDGPALGHPGAGEWAISPKVNFYNFAYQTGFFAQLTPAKWRLDAQITSIEWKTHSDSQYAGELVSQMGMRLYPDAPQPGQSAHPRVDVLVKVQPQMAGIPICVYWYDVDDPDHDGPIDTDPNYGGWQGINPADNKTTTGYGPTHFLEGAPITDANGEVRGKLDVGSIQPGNNFRVAAGGREDEMNLVKPLSHDAAGQLWFDRNDNGYYEPGNAESILNEQTGGMAAFRVTPKLTLWRKLHIERDSMGAEPPGYPFPTNDLLRGDVPNPNLSDLQLAFGEAYIQVVLGTQYDNSQTPWRHDFASLGDMNDYMVGANGERGTRNHESAAYWTAYVIGVYEAFEPDHLDNDPDSEVASTGLTASAEPEWSAIPMEIIRDVAAQHGWTPAQTAALQRSVVVHEIGHQFELGDDYNGNHTHVMCSYRTDVPGERDQYLDPISFRESDLGKIREETISV